MTWVKLCGMRNRADVAAAIEAGADAIGFVIAPGSPRQVSVADARRYGADVPLARFLVTVDLTPEALVESARAAEVTGVQPHGDHKAPAAAAALAAGLEVLYPVAVSDSVPGELGPSAAIPILDTSVPGMEGGTGRSFDWSLAAGVPGHFVLAGGLTPDTVAEAVEVSGAWGVDVSSGIESALGEKDHDLMRRFVEAVR